MHGRPDLREVPFFRHLDDDELAELEEILIPASFEAGVAIFEEGGPEERLYVVTSGTLEVSKKVLRGRRQRLATVAAPTVVGEMGLLTEPRAAATVETLTPVLAYSMGRDHLLELLDEDSPAACKFVYEIGRTLAERMAKTNASVAGIVAEIENARPGARDADVFHDRLIQEWSF